MWSFRIRLNITVFCVWTSIIDHRSIYSSTARNTAPTTAAKSGTIRESDMYSRSNVRTAAANARTNGFARLGDPQIPETLPDYRARRGGPGR